MIRFTMQPGEIVFWHNFRVMHSRTGFRNEPGREQLHCFVCGSTRMRACRMARGFLEIGEILDRQHAEGWSMLVNTPESLRRAYELIAG